MLTGEENDFLQYWENHRIRKKKVLRQLYVGLPFAVVLIIAIFANFFSGWYKRADMQIRTEETSLILVLLGGALLIVAFIVIFSARHRWEMNEQRYNELMARKNNS
jgi:membrane protein YdbS with pleckstrin-like domain